MGTVRAPSLTKVIMMNKLAAVSFQPSGERMTQMNWMTMMMTRKMSNLIDVLPLGKPRLFEPNT
jgi:hypothetical protein